jgi:VanZ family protein
MPGLFSGQHRWPTGRASWPTCLHRQDNDRLRYRLSKVYKLIAYSLPVPADGALQRGHVIAAAIVVLFILYGTLYPFEYVERDYSGGPIAYLLSTWRDWDGRGDLLSNIVLFIPFGCFTALILPSGPYGVIRVFLGTLGGALVSVSVELAQFYDQGRVTSMGDVYANGIGAMLGAVATGFIGAGARWPFVADMVAHRRPAMVLVMWAAYRLYPYVPTIDLHKYWHTVRPMLAAPNLPPGEFIRFTIVWLLIASILHVIFGARRWFLLFPLLATLEFLARILITSTDLKLPDIAGAAAAFAVWLLMGLLPGRFLILAVAFAVLVVMLRLAPFDFAPIGRPFGWVPFHSMMHGSIGVAMQAFCEKFYMYGGLIWLACQAGLNLRTATMLTMLLLFVTSYVETYLPVRSAEITDAVMALTIGLVFHLLPDSAVIRGRASLVNSSPLPR